MNHNNHNNLLEGSLLVVSPAGSSNALGRALALADLGTEVASKVIVVAPDDGPIWPAATRWVHRVHRSTRGAVLPPGVDAETIDWVWMVKPLRRGWEVATAIASENQNVALILDLDDDDEALSREFAGTSFKNRLRLHPFRQLNPAQIAQTREAALAAADAVTVASWAVAERLVPGRETIRLPHPRGATGTIRSRRQPADGTKHIGFFGTVRGHKGVESLISLLDNDAAVRLHIFAGSQFHWPEDPSRIVEHPVDESYETLFDSVDAVVLPQKHSPGGEVQLPAKLLDAMRFGVPVITSPTDAIKEIAGTDALYVENWSDRKEVAATLECCLRDGEEMGAAARERFERELSLEASAPAFRELLGRLASN